MREYSWPQTVTEHIYSLVHLNFSSFAIRGRLVVHTKYRRLSSTHLKDRTKAKGKKGHKSWPRSF